MNKVSVVIRNRNEAEYLKTTLEILTKVYPEDIVEIIVIDNNSKDDSIKIAEAFKCRVIFIEDFTYGKAINLGIREAVADHVLLLSAHAVPVGRSFFKNAMSAMAENENVAGIRFINSIENYQRALKNNFIVKDPLRFGLMAGCCLVNKKVWEEIKFDEKLPFSEDKEWTRKVVEHGYKVLDLNETFYYFIRRSKKSLLNRFKNETLAEYSLHNKTYLSTPRLVGSFLKTIFYINLKRFMHDQIHAFKIFRTKLSIQKELKKNQ